MVILVSQLEKTDTLHKVSQVFLLDLLKSANHLSWRSTTRTNQLVLFYSNNPGPLEISFPGLSCDANPLKTKNPQFWHEISCQKHWKPLHIASSSPFFKSKSANTHHFQTTFGGFKVVISIPMSLSSCISHWAMQLEEIQTCPRRVIHLQETQNFGEPKLVVASGPSLGVLTANHAKTTQRNNWCFSLPPSILIQPSTLRWNLMRATNWAPPMT